MTLETKLKFDKAMKENEPRKKVKAKFKMYCEDFIKIKNPDKEEIKEYKNSFEDYWRYMYFSGRKG